MPHAKGAGLLTHYAFGNTWIVFAFLFDAILVNNYNIILVRKEGNIWPLKIE